ncbi:NAD(P)-dependent alcohol dehydrogenase [Desertivirga arenae]|uniref:NAD(P)-dependent alcohol dehydrogenase n=1 Tax=Desertivirga arenae TaxID=2810309 RepID=UPI001A970035|nr:NAD(P)-dependent alcohol dehydrogenase [Pedobacter sp. SYSU D00823]
MKALVYREFGNINVLQIAEQPKPTIEKDEVLVKVKAFSINPLDWKIRKGEMKLMSGSKFPRYTGTDFSGIVEEVGSTVTNFKKGDEVFGVVKNMKTGASAEYISVSSSLVWKKPSGINWFQAASIPVVGTAAVNAMEKMGNLSSETKVLVNGATGGFGMFLLQLLKQRGVNVTAVTSTRGIEFAKQWGASALLNYTKDDVLSQKATYDIVVDLSGKLSYKDARPIMKAKSLFLNSTPQPIEIPTSFIKNLFTSKKHIVILSSPSAKATDILLNAVNKGLQIEVNRVFSFSKYKVAFENAEKGGYVGKVVVEMD